MTSPHRENSFLHCCMTSSHRKYRFLHCCLLDRVYRAVAWQRVDQIRYSIYHCVLTYTLNIQQDRRAYLTFFCILWRIQLEKTPVAMLWDRKHHASVATVVHATIEKLEGSGVFCSVLAEENRNRRRDTCMSRREQESWTWISTRLKPGMTVLVKANSSLTDQTTKSSGPD
jgi:hypothetical protein